MNIKTIYRKVSKTARISTYGNLSASTKYIWLVLHGSNMTCEQMLYKFKKFDPDVHFVIAPEALSRFYIKQFQGDVVAAWMTKRDRLKEIEDFSSYLTSIFDEFCIKAEDAKKIVLGFSQGGTTAYRWLHHSNIKTDFLLGYSCWIPEDIDLIASKTDLCKVKQLYTYGESDQFLTPERIDALKDVISNNSLNITICPYEGDHRVERNQLKFLFEEYIM